MKYSSIIVIALCGSVTTWTLAGSAFAASNATTNLNLIGGTVKSVRGEIQSTMDRVFKTEGIKNGIKKNSTKAKLNVSYLFGQGLAITLGAVEFQTVTIVSHANQSPVLAVNPALRNEQIQQESQADLQRNEHRLKAKELAHSARHLREQAKSLNKSIEGSANPDQSQLNEKLADIRKEIKAVDQQRAMHALAAPNEQQLQASNPASQTTTLSAQSVAVLFYQSLTQDLAATLCQQADDFAPLASNENITVLYQLHKTVDQAAMQATGWIVKNSDLQRCGKGVINSQQLLDSAQQYQY